MQSFLPFPFGGGSRFSARRGTAALPGPSDGSDAIRARQSQRGIPNVTKHTIAGALVLLLTGACGTTSSEEGLTDLDSLDSALSGEVDIQQERDGDVRERCRRAMGERAERDPDSGEAVPHPDRARDREGRRVCRIARVHRLLERFADPEELAVCRDERAACVESEDRQACRPDVRECFRPLVEEARAQVCEEHLARCEGDQAPERLCERVARRCGA